MKEIKLLDCTLREAPIGFIGDDNIRKFIGYLEKANIDIIECAFLSTLYNTYHEGSTHFTHVEQIEKFLANKKPNTIYTACFNQSEFDYDSLPEYNGKSVDGLRFVLEKSKLNAAIQRIKEIKDKGYKIFVQHRDTIDYEDYEILKVLEKINNLQPYAYSIVDTYGSTYAEDLEHIISIVQPNLSTDIRWGFHSHNNLTLANANAQGFIRTASKTHNIFIDGSILGCGIGAGNAYTELLAQYLNTKYQGQYKMGTLFDIIDTLMPYFKSKCSWGYTMPNLISGITGSVTTHASCIHDNYHLSSKSLLDVMKGDMDDSKRKVCNNDFALRHYLDYCKKNNIVAIRREQEAVQPKTIKSRIKRKAKKHFPLLFKVLSKTKSVIKKIRDDKIP
ncbi:hypothetical protein AGMMS50262_05480 [Bacteroidia bacterium]|nr:hypothetical protein AGMMS50262_05480 [Bacteroidia bacterium]